LEEIEQKIDSLFQPARQGRGTNPDTALPSALSTADQSAATEASQQYRSYRTLHYEGPPVDFIVTLKITLV
jgi:hypothetical protein